MDTKRLLLSAVAVLSLIACGTANGPKVSSENPEIAATGARILAASACREDGATLSVPSDKYPTIASALGAAKPGDVVRVAANALPFKECPVLVDGVTIMGPVVPRGQPPAVTLDGASCTNCVVCGDATIVHGATLKGFRIIQSPSFGIYLNGSKGVYISDMAIESATAAGIRSDQSSFVLERSRLLDNGGRASVRITRGSEAILAGNEIQGRGIGVSVDMGRFYEEPGWAPSQAWLFDNRIHSNGSAGLWVSGKGTKVRGYGNRYDGNLAEGVHVTGGAVYVGLHESITGNTGAGLDAFGCELQCRDAACNIPVLVQESTAVTLNSTDIRDNQGVGAYAHCGATIEVKKSNLSGNWEGVMVESPLNLDADHRGWAPATLSIRDSIVTGNLGNGGVVRSTPYAEGQWATAIIDARDTVFAGHLQGSGIWILGKGAVGKGRGNRYEGNGAGIHVSGGASYFGQRDSFEANGLGLFNLGQESMCNNPGCTTGGIVQGEVRVELDGATISRNGGGLVAVCGTTVELRDTVVTGNADNGAVLNSICDWGDLGVYSVPVVLDARETVFADHSQWGVIAYEDSHLLLGSLAEPGGNSFLRNTGAIANITPNPVLAQWNWFGTTDAAAIASSIVDCRADPSYGCVDYVPFLSRATRGNSR